MRRRLFSLVAGKRTVGISGQPRILLYESEARRIARYARSSPSLEIGGDLFGFYEPRGNPLILVATGPGPAARRDSTHFQQDPEFQAAVFNQLATKFRMFYIGDWHSHHSIQLSEPSGPDNAKLQDLANKNGWSRLCSLIVQTEISSPRHGRHRDEKEADGPTEGHGIWWNAFQYDFHEHQPFRDRVAIDVQGDANPYELTSENIDATLKENPHHEAYPARGFASSVLPSLEDINRNEPSGGNDDLLGCYQEICRSLSAEIHSARMEVDLESANGPTLIVLDNEEKVTCNLTRQSHSTYRVVIDIDGGKPITFDVPSARGGIGPSEVRRISASLVGQIRNGGDQKTRHK